MCTNYYRVGSLGEAQAFPALNICHISLLEGERGLSGFSPKGCIWNNHLPVSYLSLGQSNAL